MKKIIFIFSILFTVNHLFAQAEGGYKPGDKATDFRLVSTTGDSVSMSNYKDAKGFIVIFTCNHCPFAQAYEQRIIDLHKVYAEKGYPVIAINPNDSTREPEDSYAKMKERASEKMYPFSYLLDADQTIAKKYGAMRTPHVFLVHKEKKGFIVRYIGAIDDNYEDASMAKEHYLADAISQLEAGKKVNKDFTRAIGCGIKWSKK